ncbi:MAG TPA: hypothetical protein PLV08_09290 [Flavobacteriales bacterium]|jgi:hypothetical protein|nr:hypothetical protein [Flavobacteriales bacterium]MBK6551654.1 hypothetical protein [Flavobacteriales bacterium]MBK7101600.1 hypothetical protein [Flavobacteriales bacterium]MBK7112306.1 hypothetical protein [Flavobacteriales bacterium]MBK7481688.1 hypothetical protein [Flavobacteriales bacterium]
MKAITISAFLFLTPLHILYAQEAAEPDIRTLFGGERDLANGGWGAPSVSFTRIMDHDALLVGGRGGWLIDHGFTLGLAGHGLVTDVPNRAYDLHRSTEGDSLYRGSRFVMGYGGLLLEPIIAPRSPIHISLPIIVGAGGCGYQTFQKRQHDEGLYWYADDDYQAFFVVDAGVELEFNLIRLVRLGVGASYRYTTDITLPETPKDALHGFNAGITVKVGCF